MEFINIEENDRRIIPLPKTEAKLPADNVDILRIGTERFQIERRDDKHALVAKIVIKRNDHNECIVEGYSGPNNSSFEDVIALIEEAM